MLQQLEDKKTNEIEKKKKEIEDLDVSLARKLAIEETSKSTTSNVKLQPLKVEQNPFNKLPPYESVSPHEKVSPFEKVSPYYQKSLSHHLLNPYQQSLNNQSSVKDDDYALKILKEEKIEQELRRQQQEYEDEILAKRILDQEKKAEQLKVDESIARKMEAEERNKNQYHNHNQITRSKRDHSLYVHNTNCSCRNVSVANNNHIFEVHQMHCGCKRGINYHRQSGSNVYNNNGGWGNYFNQLYRDYYPYKHVHDDRCCLLDHIHTKQCRCVFRDRNLM